VSIHEGGPPCHGFASAAERHIASVDVTSRFSLRFEMRQKKAPFPNFSPAMQNNSRKKQDMRPSVALEMNRNAVREAVSRFRTANPRVFGSVMRGTDQEGSDLDLLVDALPGATLFDLGGLQEELESLLGVHVELLTPADLPPKFRARVLAEARPV
jgi:predicted nucleotidyltransferase